MTSPSTTPDPKTPTTSNPSSAPATPSPNCNCYCHETPGACSACCMMENPQALRRYHEARSLHETRDALAKPYVVVSQTYGAPDAYHRPDCHKLRHARRTKQIDDVGAQLRQLQPCQECKP